MLRAIVLGLPRLEPALPFGVLMAQIRIHAMAEEVILERHPFLDLLFLAGGVAAEVFAIHLTSVGQNGSFIHIPRCYTHLTARWMLTGALSHDYQHGSSRANQSPENMLHNQASPGCTNQQVSIPCLPHGYH